MLWDLWYVCNVCTVKIHWPSSIIILLISSTTGYTGDGTTTCTLMNECSLNTHNCASNADCMKTDGAVGFTCQCHAGFTGDGYQCTGQFYHREKLCYIWSEVPH